MNVSDPLKLIPPGSRTLFQPATAVQNIAAEVMPHIDGMVAIMRKHGGVGLAAPQVGLGLRFFVSSFDGIDVVINPELVDTFGGFTSKPEGCLSFPGRTIITRRSTGIVGRWTDLRGVSRQAALYDMAARCFQHELDHLNGICLFQS